MKKILEIAKDIGITIAALLLWNILVDLLLYKVLNLYPDSGGWDPRTGIQKLFFGVILAPIWEEACWRFSALEIGKSLKLPILPIVLISSITFGLAHGSIINLLYQGVFGLMACRLYLKYGYWSAVVNHALFNFFLIFLYPIWFKL